MESKGTGERGALSFMVKPETARSIGTLNAAVCPHDIHTVFLSKTILMLPDALERGGSSPSLESPVHEGFIEDDEEGGRSGSRSPPAPTRRLSFELSRSPSSCALFGVGRLGELTLLRRAVALHGLLGAAVKDPRSSPAALPTRRRLRVRESSHSNGGLSSKPTSRQPGRQQDLSGAVPPSPSEQPRLLQCPIDSTHLLISYRRLATGGGGGRGPEATPSTAGAQGAQTVPMVYLLRRSDQEVEQPPPCGIIVARLAQRKRNFQLSPPVQPDGAALSACRAATGLPLTSFSGIVRDYSRGAVLCNAPVLRKAWNDRQRCSCTDGDRSPSPLADAEGAALAHEASASMAPDVDQPEVPPPTGTATDHAYADSREPSHPHVRTASHDSNTALLSTPSSCDTSKCLKDHHDHVEEEDSPGISIGGGPRRPLPSSSQGFAGSPPRRSVTAMGSAGEAVGDTGMRPARRKLEEDMENELDHAERVLHRFLVSDVEHHSIWALEVRLPSMEVVVVPPHRVFCNDEAAEPIHDDTSEGKSPLHVRDDRRCSSATSSAIVDRPPAPLMGSTKGFLDGDFSVARFNEPAALCWQLHDACDEEEGDGKGSTNGDDVYLRHCTRLFISDAGNHAIRIADFATRQVRTVVGMGGIPGYRDGLHAEALLWEATGMAWCASGLVFADGPNRVLRLLTGVAADLHAQIAGAGLATTADAMLTEVNSGSLLVGATDRGAASHPTRESSQDRRDKTNCPVVTGPPLGTPATSGDGHTSPSSSGTVDTSLCSDDAPPSPRVWTIAGCVPPQRRQVATASVKRHRHHPSYVDAPSAHRAVFGFPADVAIIPHESSGAWLLVADSANHAVRVVDHKGVRTLIGPLDYDVAPGTASGSAGAATGIPAGLLGCQQILPCTMVTERACLLLHSAADGAAEAGPCQTPVARDALEGGSPPAEVHSSSILLFSASAMTGGLSMLMPVPQLLVERFAAEGAAMGCGEKVAEAWVVSAQQETMRLGMASEGRRRLSETGVPSVGRLLFPPQRAAGEVKEGKGSDADAAQRQLLGDSAERYVRMHFPWLMPPSAPQMSSCMPSLYCYVSGHHPTLSTVKRGAAVAAQTGHAMGWRPTSQRGGTLSNDVIVSRGRSEGMYARSTPLAGGDSAPTIRDLGETPRAALESLVSPGRSASTASSRTEQTAGDSRLSPVPALPVPDTGATLDDTGVRHSRNGRRRAQSVPVTASSYSEHFARLPTRERERRLDAVGGDEPTQQQGTKRDAVPSPLFVEVQLDATVSPLRRAVSPRDASKKRSDIPPRPLTPRSLSAHRLMQRHRPTEELKRRSSSAADARAASTSRPSSGLLAVRAENKRGHASQEAARVYAEAVSKLFTVYQHYATRHMAYRTTPVTQTRSLSKGPSKRVVATKGPRHGLRRASARGRCEAAARRAAPLAITDGDPVVEVEVTYSLPLLSFWRFLHHMGYLAAVTSLAEAQATGVGLACGEDGTYLPITPHDWRAVAEAIHRCGQRQKGYHLTANLDFHSFRRFIMFLWLWRNHAEAEEGSHRLRQRGGCGSPLARSRPGHPNEGPPQATSYALVDSLPSVDSLSEAEVVEAYSEVYRLAVQHSPSFARFVATERLPQEEPTSPPTTPRRPSAAAFHADGIGLPPTPAVSPIAGCSPVKSMPCLTPSPSDSLASAAVDKLLYLLAKNEASFQQLFAAYRHTTVLRRSSTYTVPRAAAAAAATASHVTSFISERSGDTSIKPASPLRQRGSPRSKTHRARPSRDRASVEQTTGQNILWKVRQLLTTSVAHSEAVRRSPTEMVSVVSYRSFQSLCTVIGVYPTLLSQVLLQRAYMDALRSPLVSAAGMRRTHATGSPPADEISLDGLALSPHSWPVDTNAPSAESLAEERRLATGPRVDGSLPSDRPNDAPHPKDWFDLHVMEHSGLTFIAFVEALGRVALTIFSVGEMSRAQYPTAAAKMNALLRLINQRVALGLLDVDRGSHVSHRVSGHQPCFPAHLKPFQLLAGAAWSLDHRNNRSTRACEKDRVRV